MDKEIFVDEMIYSAKRTVGDGRVSPVRRVVEVFDKQGNLIADNDPYSMLPDEIMDFLGWCAIKKIKDPSFNNIWEWAVEYRREKITKQNAA